MEFSGHQLSVSLYVQASLYNNIHTGLYNYVNYQLYIVNFSPYGCIHQNGCQHFEIKAGVGGGIGYWDISFVYTFHLGGCSFK